MAAVTENRSILKIAITTAFLCPRDEESGGILIYPCLSGYLLLQFWSYSFNILYDVYTHNGGVHVHRILIFFKYSQVVGLSHCVRRPDIDTWFVQLSPPTVLELQL